MNAPSTLTIRDREHLLLLVIAHLFFSATLVVPPSLGLWQYHSLSEALQDFTIREYYGSSVVPSTSPPVPEGVFVLAISRALTAAFPILLSTLFMVRKRYRMFSLVIAGLTSFAFPVGTVLGILTIIVLTRDSVRESYL